jgi:hypothetical protein
MVTSNRHAFARAITSFELLHFHSMRRWLVLLLLVLLPLQFSWAAVASYCVHENGAAADHLGHHDHVSDHQGVGVADTAATDEVDSSSTSASGADRGHCDGYSVGVLDLPTSFQPLSVTSAPPSLHDTPSAEHVPAQPQRPQWSRLA